MACAAHTPEALEILDPGDEDVAHEPGPALAEAEAEPELAELAPRECLPPDFEAQLPPVGAGAPQPRKGACWRPPKALRKLVADGIREEWSFEHEGSRLSIGTGCDRLGKTNDAIAEVVLHGGVGHGGSLDLTRLTKRDDGDWDVMVLGVESNYVSVPADPGGEVLRGTMPGKRVRRAIDLARTAMVVEPREVKPDPLPFGGSYGFSSADFHSLVRISDERGRSREISFTGYMGSDQQEVWTRAMLAEQAFAELIDADELDPVDVDADSQQFFTQQFLAARASGFHGWWVRERLVGMAGVHGTLDLVPTLAGHLCKGGPDSSDGRTRADALESIFELAGIDEPVTRDDHGWIAEGLALEWADACGTTCTDDTPTGAEASQ